MPEWLQSSLDTSIAGLPPLILLLRLGTAFILGCVVAGVYRLTHGETTARGLSLMATLVLLTILIGMVTLVIGNSVAKAFSLVGALSIVRFRTVVEDTRDTAFVIFAVAVGMAAGSGYLVVPLIGIPLVTVAAYLFRPNDAMTFHSSNECILTLRIGLGQEYQRTLERIFQLHLTRWRLKATSTAKQGAAISLSYHTRLQNDDSAIRLVTDLNSLDGIIDVDLKQV